MNTLINIQHEQILMKNPKIIENFRAKFPKIQPLGVIPHYNEEKYSASTQATNPVSREGNEPLEDLATNNGVQNLVTKNFCFFFEFFKKSKTKMAQLIFLKYGQKHNPA